MRKRKKSRNRELARKIGTSAGIVGGIVTAGYVAKKLVDRRRENAGTRVDEPLDRSAADGRSRGGFETGSQSWEMTDPLP